MGPYALGFAVRHPASREIIEHAREGLVRVMGQSDEESEAKPEDESSSAQGFPEEASEE